MRSPSPWQRRPASSVLCTSKSWDLHCAFFWLLPGWKVRDIPGLTVQLTKVLKEMPDARRSEDSVQDMQHGWCCRGDLGQAEVKRDVEAAMPLCSTYATLTVALSFSLSALL